MQPNTPNPEQPVPIPSVGSASQLERVDNQSATSEVGAGELATASDPATASAPVAAPVSLPATPDPAQIVQPSVDGVVPAPITSPLSAEDSDLIEPQWVDAVDTIIETTSSDPHKMEEDAEELSRKYLKERFGIDVNQAT
ncbi:MAG: hypothetical protein WCI47_00730 [bacterium]